MASATHRVRKQSWKVAVRSAREAFATRAALRLAVENDLRGAFERAFDEAAPGEHVLHIPRLELRLRIARLDALPRALAEALARELPLQRSASPLRIATADTVQCLVEYLETGTLPWHAAHDDAQTLAGHLAATLQASLAVIARQGPSGDAVSYEQAVRYYFRLLQLLPETRWQEAAAALLESTASPPFPLQELARHFAARFPIALPEADVRALASAEATISALLRARRELPKRQAHELAAELLAALRLPVSFARLIMRAPESARGAPHIPDEESEAQSPQEAPLHVVQTARHGTRRPSSPAETIQAASLMVASAGLVLVHPFLPQLLQTCGLLEQKKLKSPETAAALLHWIATGREEAFEFELGFPKLLLGLRPETPLAAGEGLVGPREREEGEALLEAVIAYWKALGRTSVEGLRSSFLQRRGAVREDDAGWRMQPETESFDMLLGHLPWGIAMVRLPWMTRPLYTDWPTP